MTKKFIILCGCYRFFFFLIVLPWFGHVLSNKGRFGHKRKLPGFFYFLTWFPQIFGEFEGQRLDSSTKATLCSDSQKETWQACPALPKTSKTASLEREFLLEPAPFLDTRRKTPGNPQFSIEKSWFLYWLKIAGLPRMGYIFRIFLHWQILNFWSFAKSFPTLGKKKHCTSLR